MSSKRKIIGPVELVILVIALGLIAYILLKSSGGNVYEHSENIQIVDNPETEGGEKQIRNYEMQDEDRVEVILQQLSEYYVDENNTTPKDRQIKDKAISEDETSGKTVREDNVSNMLENAIIAKTVYSKIEELFQIPEEDARAFAEQGKKAVSDWAQFIEQNQSKQDQ
jgi:hypothetical protein